MHTNSNIYLLTGMYEHDSKELALRRDAIYKKHRFMEEYHTILIGEVYEEKSSSLSGLISTFLSETTSHDTAIGAVSMSANQKYPLFLGWDFSIKTYTAVHLIRMLEKSSSAQLIYGKKAGIDASLEGTYFGAWCNIPLSKYSEFSQMYPEQLAQEFNKLMHSKDILSEKKYAQFELELIKQSGNGGRGGDHNHNETPSPDPVEHKSKPVLEPA